MKIWMSGEIQDDVYDAYVTSRKKIETIFNKEMSERDFGEGLAKLAFIGIIRKINSPNYDEIQKYVKRDRTAEFRLKILHESFLQADEQGRLHLIAASVLRAVRQLPIFKIKDFDCLAFETDVINLFREQGWDK